MENTFKSDEILLCSFLLTQGIRILDVIEDSPRHFIFVLSDLDRCIQLKNDYKNGAVAPAQMLFFQRENLISEIKDKNRKGKYATQK